MEKSYKTLCIVNPASANGRTKKTWRKLEGYLRQRGLDFEVMYTSGPYDATVMTQDALAKGFNHIVSVGGDGTLNEVVNGFFDDSGQMIGEDSFLSVIPMGTGGDFARMFNMSSKPELVFEVLSQKRVQAIDLVRSKLTNWKGQPETRFYINVADVGLGSETVYYTNKNSKVLRGFLSFLIFGIYSIFTFKNKLLGIKIDGEEVYAGKSSLTVVSNGCYFGGGMKIAPHASLSDGWLDVIIVQDLSKLDLLKNVKAIYAGTHLDYPGITFHRGRRVEIYSPEEIFVELDGESPGMGNLEFEVMPGVMQFII